MTDLIIDVVIPLIFGIIGVILTYYISEYIYLRFEEVKIDKKTDELILENKLGKMLFYLILAVSVFLCSIPFLFSNTFDRYDYVIYIGWALFFSSLLTISYFFVWGHRIIFYGKEINRICWWKSNIYKNTDDIEKIYKTRWNNWIIKYNDGIKIRIPEYYTSVGHFISELHNIVPDLKWI